MFPNLTYWRTQFNNIGVYSSEDVYGGHYADILEDINREDIKLLFVNGAYKLGFLGKTYSMDWYCYTMLQLLQEVSVNDFIQSFDYILYRNQDLIYSENLAEYQKQLLPQADGVGDTMSLYKQDESYSLYQVKGSEKYMAVSQIENEIAINSDPVFVVRFESSAKDYFFEANAVSNQFLLRQPTVGWVQINWLNSAGEYMHYYQGLLFVDWNENRIEVKDIVVPEGAVYGDLYLIGNVDDEIIIDNLKLKEKNKTVVEEITEEYYAAVDERSPFSIFK
jgi:hypothetical protein